MSRAVDRISKCGIGGTLGRCRVFAMTLERFWSDKRVGMGSPIDSRTLFWGLVSAVFRRHALNAHHGPGATCDSFGMQMASLHATEKWREVSRLL